MGWFFSLYPYSVECNTKHVHAYISHYKGTNHVENTSKSMTKHYRNTNFLIPTHWELNFQHMTSRQTQSVFNNSHLRILQSYQKVSILFLLHWFLDQIFPFSFCFWFVVFISDSSFQLLFCVCCFWAPEMLFLEMIIRAKTTSSTPILCSVIFLGPSLLSTMPYWSVVFFTSASTVGESLFCTHISEKK